MSHGSDTPLVIMAVLVSTHSVVEQRLYLLTELPMPGWRNLVDVQLQSLMIFQLPQYLHTVSQWLTGNKLNPLQGRRWGGAKGGQSEEPY